MTGGVSPDLGALHRTAVMLTADADLALDLVGQVLRQPRQPRQSRQFNQRRRATATPPPDPPDLLDPLTSLRADLVRVFLRTAGRPDGPGQEDVLTAAVRDRDADAYDVLRGLPPRARAVTVLRVAHGWDVGATAAAVGLTPRRAEALLPGVPGLERALDAVAERHHLTATEVPAALGQASTPAAGSPQRPRRRGARLLVVAAAGVAILLWSLLTQPDAQPDARADTPPNADDHADAHADGQVPDLTPYGWHLGEDGEPPVVAMGLQRQSVVDLPYAVPVRELTWDAGHVLPGGPAAYAVLWCDLPPSDPHIEQPSARLTTDTGSVDLPCAGRTEGPPVHQVTAVPVSGPGQVELLGDLPRAGGATLALYREGALSGTLPLPGQAGGAEPPEVPAGAAAVEEVLVPRDWEGRTRLAESLVVSAGSELQVWAGRAGSVSVFVDGLPVTDDGDLAAEDPGWRGQQLDLRDGRWVVYLPGTSRTFPLPERLRPPDGQRRTVTVEVFTQGMEQDVQVLATRAEPGQPRPAAEEAIPLDLRAAADFPDHTGDHRLVGAWSVPQDGLGHDLRLEGGPELPGGAELVAFTGAAPVGSAPDRDEGWGLVQHLQDGRVVVQPLPLAPGAPDVGSWGPRRLDPWRVQQDLTVPATDAGTVGEAQRTPRVWLPAVPGHPTATVLALEPVWDNGAR
ncbi:hypothetical protein [Ornithinimicrobium sufpigmenti]|uniref:hypothetical protein n=1 Tax=Ornithinimicrobium sufpigmenti TaxID=2508882 RepID=UPI0010365996|nr:MULTISPECIES: hypothetical protein [unclassified Ornithinimicrobium]